MKKKIVGVGVGVIIQNKKAEVLLGWRVKDKTWGFPGGKMEFKESFEETAVREIEEETSLKITKRDLVLISLANDIHPEVHFVTIGFFTKKWRGDLTIAEPHKISKWEWFNLNNLPKPIFSPSQKMLGNFKAGKLYQAHK